MRDKSFWASIMPDVPSRSPLGWGARAGELVFHASACFAQRELERPGAEGVAGGAPERLDHSGPPVAQRGVGEKAGDLSVKDAAGEGVLRDAHSLAVAEGEARELLCPRVAGDAVAPGGPGLAF